MIVEMKGIATIRVFLVALGIAVLLLNPAGVCAGNMSAPSPSHPCCPNSSGDTAKSSCLCIEAQSSAPILASPGEQAQFAFLAPAPSMDAQAPVEAPESRALGDLPLPPHAIILSIHQLLL